MKNKWIVFAGIVAAGGIAIYFLTRKKKGKVPEFTFDEKGNVVLPPGEKKYQEQLDYLKAKIPGSKRYSNSLDVFYWSNFYIRFFDNGRFVLGAAPNIIFPYKGYWKDFGNTWLFDDGRAFTNKTIDENLATMKNALFTSKETLKHSKQYQDFLKTEAPKYPSYAQEAVKEKFMSDLMKQNA